MKNTGGAKPKILIVNHMHPSIHPLLEDLGFEVDYRPTIQASQVPEALQEAVGLIIRSKVFVNDALVKGASHLRFVARAGAGVDNVSVAELEARGIRLINAPEGNRDALAEHTVGMLLMLFNRLRWADEEVRRGVWERERNRGYELKGRTVGIMGYGHMGQALAQRLQGFGCRVIAYDKYRSEYGDDYAEAVDLATLFQETDVFSVHVPLCEENRFLIDREFLSRFKRPIYLINTSRGEVLSLSDLVEHMKVGKIRGAVLDVLENESLDSLSEAQQAAFDYLKSSEHTVFSPHVAGWSHESFEKINQILAEKIASLKLA